MPHLEMPILSLELLYLSLVAGVLLAHEGDVVGGLLEDLRAGALISVVHAEMGEQNLHVGDEGISEIMPGTWHHSLSF